MTTGTADGIPQALLDRGVGQVGILVPSLEEGLRTYGSIPSIESWSIYTYGPATVPRLEYRGTPGSFAVRIALGGTSPQLELMESVNGPSIYEEWLEQHGHGLHHLGFFVPSLDSAIAAMAAAGFTVLQRGAGYGMDGDGGFAYFDTGAVASVILEAIEVPARRRPPESVWRR